MNASPKYYVEPSNGRGDTYTTNSAKDAFSVWSDDHSQAVTMVEFDGSSYVGKAFDMTEDFREMVAEQRSEARAWDRHCQSYARAS